jgi:hypothetical protein
MSDSFEELPGAKRLEYRAAWEKQVFVSKDVDVSALRSYLQSLFPEDNDNAAQAIVGLRNNVQEFEDRLGQPKQFSISTLRWVIDGLQMSDLLSNDRRESLKDFLSNDTILGEVCQTHEPSEHSSCTVLAPVDGCTDDFPDWGCPQHAYGCTEPVELGRSCPT